jgi:hypothetical protein
MLNTVLAWLGAKLLGLGASWLESKFPSFATVIAQVVAFFEGGATASQVSAHLQKFPSLGSGTAV